MVEIGDQGLGDMREGSGRQHGEAHDSQYAAEKSGSEARPPKSTIQREEVDDPKDEDHQVESILNRSRRSYVGEPHELPFGLGRVRSHEHNYYYEDDNEDDGAQDAGQTTPPKNAFLLIHRLHLGILPRFDVLT